MTTAPERVSVDTTELAASFRGPLIGPDDPRYDEQRTVWNGAIDRRPSLIARCSGVADVMSAVRFAREKGIPSSVRSGGHSFPGHAVHDDTMMIDLSMLKGVRVDPAGKTVRMQAGVTLGELDRETQAFGLAVPSGIVTTTGVAGLTLGGGIGWLMRKYGLTIDQLLSVDMVTAEGELVHASAEENTDLFWGVRGAGGNFGIVTEFEYRLNSHGPNVMCGPIFWPLSDSPDVLRFYRDWIKDAPDELTTIVVHRMAPPLPVVPEELHGKPVVTVICCYTGPVKDAEKVLAPMKSFGTPVLDLCVPKPFAALQAMFDPSFPKGWWYYFRSADLAELTDDVIDIIVENANKLPTPQTAFPIFQLGGAIRNVGENDTAFGGRQAGHTININATTTTGEGFEAASNWSKNFWTELQPYHTSAYINFLMDEGEDRVRQAYGAEKYDRLKALKKKYDPTNFFSHNQNIRPD